MEFDINDVAAVGSVADQPPYMLPPETWSEAINMRVQDEALEKLLGWTQCFGTPGVAPHFAMPIRTSSANFWLYTSLTKAYVYDGVSHTNITRQSAGVDVNYAASGTEDWNGTLFASVPIINNGTDIPQFWSAISPATKLANLTNWPSTLRAKFIRSFGPFLVVGNITDSGNNYPHTVAWSHPADPGSIPSSWDHTDATKDAGRKDLPDVSAGLLVDALPLASTMFLYKEGSIWKMRFIGGRFIFDFGESAWLTTAGALAQRCVAITGDGTRHVVATQDDIVWHNGNTVESILNMRQKRRLFNEIDTTNYFRSFMFCNPLNNEMWFCYPGQGSDQPNKALIMNYGDKRRWVVTEADGITFRNAIVGPIEAPAEVTWAADTGTWADDDGPWTQLSRRRVVLCSPANTKFYDMDNGATRDGTAFSSTLRRIGLALIGQKRNGQLIVDHQKLKMAKRVWPKIRGGNSVDIRFGAQDVVDGAVRWGTAVAFNSATDVYCDPDIIEGRAIAIEYTSNNSWKIDGYKIDLETLGDF